MNELPWKQLDKNTDVLEWWNDKLLASHGGDHNPDFYIHYKGPQKMGVLQPDGEKAKHLLHLAQLWWDAVQKNSQVSARRSLVLRSAKTTSK